MKISVFVWPWKCTHGSQWDLNKLVISIMHPQNISIHGLFMQPFPFPLRHLSLFAKYFSKDALKFTTSVLFSKPIFTIYRPIDYTRSVVFYIVVRLGEKVQM